MKPADDHGLEFLLAFDGRIHHLEEGYVERVLRERGIKTTVVRVEEKGKRK